MEGRYGSFSIFIGKQKNETLATMKRGKSEYFALPVFLVHRTTNDQPKATLFCGTGSKADFSPTFA